MMITKLTKEQEDKMSEYADKWIEIGLSTDECDREKAEHWCSEAYKAAGLEPPKQFIWTNNPIECAELADKLDDKGARVGNLVRYQIQREVMVKVSDCLKYRAWDQVWDELRFQVDDKISPLVGRQVIWGQLKERIDYHIWSKITRQICGAHDAGWLCCNDYMLNELSIKECERIVPLMELAKECGRWDPFENVAILQEKPEKIRLKDGNEPNIFYRSVG
jgi:hypothetical protein